MSVALIQGRQGYGVAVTWAQTRVEHRKSKKDKRASSALYRRVVSVVMSSFHRLNRARCLAHIVRELAGDGRPSCNLAWRIARANTAYEKPGEWLTQISGSLYMLSVIAHR